MKKRFLCALVALVCLISTGCAAEKTRQSVVGMYFDTVVMLNAYVEDKTVLEDALAQCAEYERLFSKTIEGSDVYRLNHADGAPVVVSKDVIQVLTLANAVSEMSEGAFDVSVYPAQALWDFTGGSAVLPDENALAEAAQLIDYRNIVVEGDRVTLQNGATIDLGGVAKGYIADRIGAYLRERGVTDALLNFGGNVLALGKKPEGAWTVGVRDPKGGEYDYLLALAVTDMSVVTSGIYERGFDLDGVRYHHILDSKTGWPIQNNLASATIITGNSGLADALSTAVFALGETEGLRLIESIAGAEAILVDRDQNIYFSSGAETYLANPHP